MWWLNAAPVGQRRSRSWLRGAQFATMLAVLIACSSTVPVDEGPSLDGVVSLEPIPVESTDVWGASAIEGRKVRVVYDVGSCRGEANALQVARSVVAIYSTTEVRLSIDGTVRCSGDRTDEAYSRAAIITLEEDIGGRRILLEN